MQQQRKGHKCIIESTSTHKHEICALICCRWETGYWRSMDIMHDRAGYYICWGCLVWVPAVYTSPALYLTMHGVQTLSAPLAVTIAAIGAAAIYINYDSDRQRQASAAACCWSVSVCVLFEYAWHVPTYIFVALRCTAFAIACLKVLVLQAATQGC